MKKSCPGFKIAGIIYCHDCGVPVLEKEERPDLTVVFYGDAKGLQCEICGKLLMEAEEQ